MSAAEHLGNDPASELWGEHRARYRFVLRLVGGQRVLDVASGAGFGLQMLRQAGASAVGFDYDAEALREVRTVEPAAPLVNGDATRMPLADGWADVVVSFETLEHVPDAAAMVRELRRILKPGGSLVLSTPNRSFGPPERHTDNPFHIQEFTAAELRALLRSEFASVELFGQRPSRDYRYVPFLMVEPDYSPRALAWKVLLRVPRPLRDQIAQCVSGRPFYPGEDDYTFDADRTDGANTLVAIAR